MNQRYADELDEDPAGLVATLESLGVAVHRPVDVDAATVEVVTSAWSASVVLPLDVRDNTLIAGDEIVETPPMTRSRYFATQLLKPVFAKYFRRGARGTVGMVLCFTLDTVRDGGPPPRPDGTRDTETQGDPLREHISSGLPIGWEAVESCLGETDTSLSDIRYLCCVGSTGFITPGFSALPIREVGISRHCSRLDVVGMGLVDQISDDLSEAVQTAAILRGRLSGREVTIRRRLLPEAAGAEYEEALGAHLAAYDRELRRLQASGTSGTARHGGPGS
ncbi:hypothetical protein GCM10022252_71590 [Streptosporangium oxazolinicum]|uniref:PAC2 family protein n=1 Tax=Streptosporangium oxazolinicum TaxID=909287 RepID=A0ABP8BIC3_9ACTN